MIARSEHRHWYLNLVGGSLVWLLPVGWLAAAPADTRPNFVLIYVDDLGWKDAGFLGTPYFETPNIDSLAKEGMVFTSAYANAPNCAPSRACLLSGQYAPRHGIYTTGKSDRGPSNLRRWIPVANRTVLKAQAVTIAEALKAAGYVSASIGKWHLGDDPAAGPHSQGFDLNVGGNHLGHTGSYFSPYHLSYLSDGPEGEYLTDRLTNEAIQFIVANKTRPFFLYLAHYAVHTPIEGKLSLVEKYKAKEGNRRQDSPDYAAMIETLDQTIGLITKALVGLSLDETTVIIFLSDNGGFARATSMAPLRGSKGTIYEGGIRVPMIVRWPGRIAPGRVSDVPVSGVDLYRTMLDIAQVRPPQGYVLDGESLLPLLMGKGTLPERAIFWHFPVYVEPDSGIRGPWKATPCSAVRKGDWKLIEQFETGQLELYNLRDDIGEATNLATSRKDKAEELHQLLVAWRAATHAPVPLMKNPAFDPQAPVVMEGGAQDPE